MSGGADTPGNQRVHAAAEEEEEEEAYEQQQPMFIGTQKSVTTR